MRLGALRMGNRALEAGAGTAFYVDPARPSTRARSLAKVSVFDTFHLGIYDARPMFDGLPAVIDPLRLADEGAELHGALGLGDMPRLLELCADDSGTASVDLYFERGAQGLRQMHGTVRAEVPVVCQRCLMPFRQAISAETWQVLLKPGEPSAVVADDADALVVTKPLPLSEIIEDELLLAMPMIPRHAPGQCRTNTAESASAIRETNPFAALHRLKRD